MNTTDTDYLLEVTAPLLADLLDHEDHATFRQAVHHHCSQNFMFESPLKEAGFLASLATTLYECMPLPHRNFQQGEVKKPKRNEPCLCGSGKKYKQCCALLGEPPRPAADELFSLAVESLNQKTWKKLANHSALPRNMRLIMMYAAMEDQKPKKAWQLVSPLFDNLKSATDADEDLLSLGFEALRDLKYDAKRLKYMQALIELKGAKSLQALGHMRLAMYEADVGVLEGAENHLEQARRLVPEHPDLPIVELNILQFTASDEELRQRARFWQKRIDKLWGDAYPYRAFVDDLAENGRMAADDWMAEAMENEDPGQFKVKTKVSDLEQIASRVENVLLRSMGLLIEGVAQSGGHYHLGTVSAEAKPLEAWHSAWMQGVTSLQRPGTPAEYAGKWAASGPKWLTLLESKPQLCSHSMVLLELLEWVKHAPDLAEVFAMQIDEMLRMQRLCLINKLIQLCSDESIQLEPAAVQNTPLILHMSNQLEDFLGEGYYSAAEGLARNMVAVIKDAQSVIPEIEDLLEFY